VASAPDFSVDLPDEAATAALAEDIAACLAVGDVVALSGGLGAGKTTLARALIRALADDPGLEVPSPTFTLVQTYATSRLAVAHFDLYRLAGPDELAEVGFPDAAADAAVLVEWPERAGDWLPADALVVTIEIAGTGRRADVVAGGSWPDRLARSRSLRAFLDGAGWRGASRRHLQADASTRTYERIGCERLRAVLMDWPARTMLPAGDFRAAYRARDVGAFVAVDAALRAIGLSAPEIHAADFDRGFLLMEDLGTEGIVHGAAPDPERYAVAIDVLAAIHAAPRSAELPLPGGAAHRLPPLGRDALAAELAMFTDWYVPHATGVRLTESARREFAAAWDPLFALLATVERSWVLFDVQSPNLFWLGEREGLARIGLIDFQDMFFGPSAYDVASLCQDARVTVPAGLEIALRDQYVARRRSADPTFDVGAFHSAYAILAAVRNFKNLGVFARLAAIGRPAYLGHMPRLRAYLAGTLSHPVLSRLRLWYEGRLPS